MDPPPPPSVREASRRHRDMPRWTLLEWLAIVAAPPYPRDPRRTALLARQAIAKLDRIAAALERDTEVGEVLALAATVTVGRPALDTAGLRQPASFLRWLWPFVREPSADIETIFGPTPPCRFHALIT